MTSVNKVFILGHAGLEPENHGDDVVSVSVATSEKWKDKITGEKKEATEWHRIIFFGKLAEIAKQYIKKGSLLHVEGNLQTKKYVDKDGIERYATNIRAHSFKMLDKKPSSAHNNEPNPYAEARGISLNQSSKKSTTPTPYYPDHPDDDISF
jgi:single-strand DNA-binding protein